MIMIILFYFHLRFFLIYFSIYSSWLVFIKWVGLSFRLPLSVKRPPIRKSWKLKPTSFLPTERERTPPPRGMRPWRRQTNTRTLKLPTVRTKMHNIASLICLTLNHQHLGSEIPEYSNALIWPILIFESRKINGRNWKAVNDSDIYLLSF